jgi:hypothetical protein
VTLAFDCRAGFTKRFAISAVRNEMPFRLADTYADAVNAAFA